MQTREGDNITSITYTDNEINLPFSFSLFNNIWAPLSCGAWWNLTGITSARFPGWIKALSRFVSCRVCECGEERVPSHCPWKTLYLVPNMLKMIIYIIEGPTKHYLWESFKEETVSKMPSIKLEFICSSHTQFRHLVTFFP